MKKIFEWMREQIYKHSYSKYDRGNWFASFIPTKIAVDLINEAEAKWEADCCEWRCGEVMLKSPHKISKFTCTKDGDFKYTFCPDCGKPIKISEVE